jgi:hypothetical protein
VDAVASNSTYLVCDLPALSCDQALVEQKRSLRFRVQSRNTAAVGTDSFAYANVTCLGDVPQPWLLTVHNETALQLTWPAVNDPWVAVLGYQIEYALAGTGFAISSTVDVNGAATTSLVVAGLPLTDGAPWDMRVRARNAFGLGPVSTEVTKSLMDDAGSCRGFFACVLRLTMPHAVCAVRSVRCAVTPDSTSTVTCPANVPQGQSRTCTITPRAAGVPVVALASDFALAKQTSL